MVLFLVDWYNRYMLFLLYEWFDFEVWVLVKRVEILVDDLLYGIIWYIVIFVKGVWLWWDIVIFVVWKDKVFVLSKLCWVFFVWRFFVELKYFEFLVLEKNWDEVIFMVVVERSVELYLICCEENLYGFLEVYWFGDIVFEFLLVRCRRFVFCLMFIEDVVRFVFDWLCIILMYDEVCWV